MVVLHTAARAALATLVALGGSSAAGCVKELCFDVFGTQFTSTFIPCHSSPVVFLPLPTFTSPPILPPPPPPPSSPSQVLTEPGESQQVLEGRARALRRLGQIFQVGGRQATWLARQVVRWADAGKLSRGSCAFVCDSCDTCEPQSRRCCQSLLRVALSPPPLHPSTCYAALVESHFSLPTHL